MKARGKRVIATAAAALAVAAMGATTAAPAGAVEVRAETRADARAEPVYGKVNDLFQLIDGRVLLRVDSRLPALVKRRVTITGMQPGERLVGIDIRPATKTLYAVGSSSRLYRVNPATGAVTQVGAPFATPLSGTRFGVDFNPTVDLLRVVSNTGQDLRIVPDNRTTPPAVPLPVNVDGTLTYAPGDVNAGTAPNATAAAYTNNRPPAPPAVSTTALFLLDTGTDALVRQGNAAAVPPVSPNSGQLFTIGALGIDIADVSGFDISIERNVAYAAIRREGRNSSELVRINLTTGRATPAALFSLPGRVDGLTFSQG